MKNVETAFGNFMLKLMEKHNDDVKNASKKLNISKSYLYYLITGKRNCSDSIKNRIIEKYELDYDTAIELNEAIIKGKNIIKIDLTCLDYECRKIIIKIIKELPEMSKSQINCIKNILQNSGDIDG